MVSVKENDAYVMPRLLSRYGGHRVEREYERLHSGRERVHHKMAYVFKVHVFSLNPPFIRCVDPSQVHDFQIEAVLCSVLQVSWRGKRKYLIFRGADVANN